MKITTCICLHGNQYFVILIATITILYNIVALTISTFIFTGEELNKRSRFRSDPRVSIMPMFCICTVCRNKYEPPHDKTNKMACASSEDSDQPGHPPSLIRVIAVVLNG